MALKFTSFFVFCSVIFSSALGKIRLDEQIDDRAEDALIDSDDDGDDGGVVNNSAGKPHIVFFLADDLGYGNVAWLNDNGLIKTPVLDSLAKNGIQLHRFYTHSACSPSRSSFISGRLPVHVNLQASAENTYHNPEDLESGYAGVTRSMTGIGMILKKAGYRTAQIGKWDVGMATRHHTPKGRGFDRSLGYFGPVNDYYNYTSRFSCESDESSAEYNANDYYYYNYNSAKQNQGELRDRWTEHRDLWRTEESTGREGPAADEFPEQPYEESIFLAEALEVISSHTASTPLFMYYASHLIHKPNDVPKKWLDSFNGIQDDVTRAVLAMTAFLDAVVGSIVHALTNKGMWKNTVFVFCGDNGGMVIDPQSGGNNWPLRGAKFSPWEGGIRTPSFIAGGYVPEQKRGTVTSAYVHICDWYATFAGLAGVSPIDESAAKAKVPPIDSIDQWATLMGPPLEFGGAREDIFVQRVDKDYQRDLVGGAYISGRYKLITGVIAYNSWLDRTAPSMHNQDEKWKDTFDCHKQHCLFDIISDPGEHANLISSEPDVAKRLLFKLHHQEQFLPERGVAQAAACEHALKVYGRVWGPWLQLSEANEEEA